MTLCVFRKTPAVRMGICNSGQWDVRRISMYYLSVKQGRVGMSPPFFPLLPWSCRSHVPNGIWHGGGWQLTLHRAWVGLRHWDFDHYLPQHDLAYKKKYMEIVFILMTRGFGTTSDLHPEQMSHEPHPGVALSFRLVEGWGGEVGQDRGLSWELPRMLQ